MDMTLLFAFGVSVGVALIVALASDHPSTQPWDSVPAHVKRRHKQTRKPKSDKGEA